MRGVVSGRHADRRLRRDAQPSAAIEIIARWRRG